MKSQLKKLGLSIDWDREISTCSEEYYKHQQKIFLELYDKGLVYRKENYVNWDPVDQTVLANEQVINGKGWRSNATVERKKLSQWFLNITKFSDELLNCLDELPGWPEKVKLMQHNWIGKSEGATVRFNLEKTDAQIEVFTTRPDTLYGASFIAISAQHPLATSWQADSPELQAFIAECARLGTSEAAIEKAEKKDFSLAIMPHIH